MGRLAMTHRGRASVKPTMDLLEPYIERTDNHWYWLGEFYDDGLDRCAEFDWSPPAERSTKWMVPRLLWQLTNVNDAPRLMLENTCGLYTCINPAHWKPRNAVVKTPARIVLTGDVEAMPVMHPAATVLVHIRRNDSVNTVCGRHMEMYSLPKTSAVTCDECIAGWVRTGNLYTESK